MSYPLLKNIDKYVKENGIATQEVYVSTNRLPVALKEAAIRELSKTGIEYKLDNLFIVSYDNNGNLSLILTFNDAKTNLLITDTPENLVFPNASFKYTRIKSDRLFRKAQQIEWVNKKEYLLYERLYDKYMRKYEEYLEKAVTEEEKENRKQLVFRKKNEFKSLLRDQLELLSGGKEPDIDLDSKTLFNKQLQSLESVVEQYMSYINNETIEREKEESHSEVVYFTPEEPEGSIRRNGSPIGKVLLKERKNRVMGANYRFQIIKELEPILNKVAIPSVKVKVYGESEYEDDIDNMYKCSLFSLGDDEYKLVMEPFNGIKYTKVAYFVYRGELTDEVLNNIIRKYVSLNTEHVRQLTNLVRIGHTSPETYYNELRYAILGDKKLNCYYYFMDKVDKMTPEVIEKEKTL